MFLRKQWKQNKCKVVCYSEGKKHLSTRNLGKVQFEMSSDCSAGDMKHKARGRSIFVNTKTGGYRRKNLREHNTLWECKYLHLAAVPWGSETWAVVESEEVDRRDWWAMLRIWVFVSKQDNMILYKEWNAYLFEKTTLCCLCRKGLKYMVFGSQV